jgi:hypothetical protein
VYITDLSGDTRRTVIASAGEGGRARWRADGRELYYSAPNREVMVVPIEQGPTGLVPGTPRGLFKATGRFEAAAAGDRFLVLKETDSQDSTPVHVLTGWQREAR